MLLEIRNLSSRYGRIQALHSIDVDVDEGELVALVGANGAGKTTLLRTISGVQPPSEGTVTLANRDITTFSSSRRVKLGVVQVPEGRQVFGPMSVEDNLLLGSYTRERAEAARTIEEMYARFPILKEKRHQMAGTLSGGQQQMLTMGRALMAKPRILLLDEPSMGLAPLLVDEIFEIVSQLRSAGTTIFMVEQNAFMALEIADRAYVLEAGHVTLSGTGEELLSNEKVIEAYLGI
ncbi:MAG: ABC transporter ATP-binding protein [Rhodospirillaceae bacterium]|jgi:branched-chain amino acid transport system ATP-binding protein|nr:ABC transporter ATP-binding protein [Rhodospirillaceae bacterium]MBT5242732.1 ABC transporter ATP-binding protein [Rhodospirillaceae bacterium]MBT5561545.1 ABC transporter ATP-binding protein [Rhodospirillaceae bacterium]MBT6241857.1 ABC transporter ATP-binding protein [Rhodospirillaceae bacterium]MBT7138658.1 ABC transporter ATP-binding protein [Rhodospirillaceae bacterium]